MIDFDLYLAKCTGNKQNVIYPIKMRVSNEAGLVVASGWDHVAADFKDHRRSTENFIRANVILADCDNDDSDDPKDWISPDNVAHALPGVEFYAVSSRHCGKVKHAGEPGEKSARPRYHYYFPVRQVITDPAQVGELQKRLLEVLPSFDPGGMKPAQFFFGHDDPQATYFPGTVDLAEYFAAHPAFAKPSPEMPSIPDENFIRDNIDSLLSCISADCDHDIWVRVGMGIKAAGLPFSVWDDWSRSAPAKYPGATVTEKKWNSFRRSGVSAGTLVYLAKNNGWTPPRKVDQPTNKPAALQWHDPGTLPEDHREKIAALLKRAGCRGSLVFEFDSADGPVVRLEQDGRSDLILIRTKESRCRGWKGRKQLQEQGVLVLDNNRLIPVSSVNKTIADIVATSVMDASGVEIREEEYLYFPWFIRGKLTSLQGDTGAGKSTFLYAVGAAVSKGSDILGVPCEDPGCVMYITTEDTHSDILTAHMDSGGDPQKIRFISRDLTARLDLSDGGIEILDAIIHRHNLKLLVLDPLQAFLRGDMNKANDTRPQLARLAGLAEKHNICISFIQHMGKDSTKAALHRGVGSVDIGAATRSMLQVVVDPKDPDYRIMFTVKNNAAAPSEVFTGLRYRIRSRAETMEGRHHFHGHAEFAELLPFYDEKIYHRELRRAEEREEEDAKRRVDYAKDPLIITARQLIAQNPGGMFIGFSEFIRRITEVAGYCPYTQDKSAVTGLAHRIRYVREEAVRTDHFQMDISPNNIKFQPYHWRGMIVTQPDVVRERGVYLRPVTTFDYTEGQQTEF